MTPAGFWRRVVARTIDTALFVPFSTLGLGLVHSRTWRSVLPVATLAVFGAYTVWCHAIWGQTIGKAVARIRVVGLDGELIGFGRALLRLSVDLVLGLMSAVGTTVAVLKIPATAHAALGWVELTRRTNELRPTVFSVIGWIALLWLVVDAAVLVSNAHRRAAHDFLAGTRVVVHDGRGS